MAFLSRLSDHAAIAVSNAQLYAAVQAANITKSEFISSAVHELKNPLTSVKGYSDLLIAGSIGPVNDGQVNFLNIIRSNAERMSTLVSDLQDVSRIEAGQLRLEFSSVQLVDVIDEVLQSFRSQIEEKEQNLHLRIPEDLPLVWSDKTRQIKIVTNLVSNANKYTPQGGDLFVKVEHVNNKWDPNGTLEVIHVIVRDTCIGISPEDQSKIFQQFFRSEDSQVRQEGGTGLGLSITKRLVEMQGGRIWFESVHNHGTTFYFTVPVGRLSE